MSLRELVRVDITTETLGITRATLEVPLIASYHTVFPERVKTFGSLSELVDAGFSAATPTYKAVQALLSATPQVSQFKVGRRLLPFTQIVRIIPTDITPGTVYTITIDFPNGTSSTISYTVVGVMTVATIIDALVVLLNALAGATYFTVTDGGTYLQIATNTPGVLLGYRGWNRQLDFIDTTANPGIATDLAEIAAIDSDWYFLGIDSNSEAEINAAAAWMETRRGIALFNSGDYGILDPVSITDIAYDLFASSYARSALIFNRSTDHYAGLDWVGETAPADPGSLTWAFKTLNAPVDQLVAGDRTAMKAKNCNFFWSVAGRNIAFPGKTASGEYIDVTHFVDWLTTRMEERLFLILANNPKLPYTNPAVQTVIGEVYAQLYDGIAVGGLASDPVPIVTAPDVRSVSAVTKANRILPDINFRATLAGAVHEIEVQGTISL